MPELIECVPQVGESYLISWDADIFTGKVLKIITVGLEIPPANPCDMAWVQNTVSNVKWWVPVHNLNHATFYKVKAEK